jgi:3-dehydroquinate dehydratase-1
MRDDICLSIGNVGFDCVLKSLEGASLAEIRFDLMDLSNLQYQQIFGHHKNLIATHRLKAEEYDTMTEILSLAIDWGCNAIDIDRDTPEHLRIPLINKAKQNKRTVIISYHNFVETPEISKLETHVKEMVLMGADIVKIACMANSVADCSRILGLYENHQNIIAFCMGAIGQSTRIVAPLLGAPFTYASIEGFSTAPGQIEYGKMEVLLDTFKK